MPRSRTLTVNEIQKLDRIAIEEVGIPSIVLMENAGRAVSREITRTLKTTKGIFVSVVCGLGNNAGDGFVVARHLMNAGVKVKAFLLTDKARLKSDPSVNYKILERLKCPIKQISCIDTSTLNDLIRSDIIVDAIFGVGLNREIKQPLRGIIETLNSIKKRIVSVDVPSGLDATTGGIYGVCIKANMTVTFSFLKKGFFKKEGPKYVGRVVVADIGIPKKLISKLKIKK